MHRHKHTHAQTQHAHNTHAHINTLACTHSTHIHASSSSSRHVLCRLLLQGQVWLSGCSTPPWRSSISSCIHLVQFTRSLHRSGAPPGGLLLPDGRHLISCFWMQWSGILQRCPSHCKHLCWSSTGSSPVLSRTTVLQHVSKADPQNVSQAPHLEGFHTSGYPAALLPRTLLRTGEQTSLTFETHASWWQC